MRDLAVDGHKPHPLLHCMIGRLHPRRLEEGEVIRAVVTEPPGDVLRFAPLRRTPRPLRPLRHGPPGAIGRTSPLFGRHLLAAVPNAERALDLRQQLLGVTARHAVGQRVAELVERLPSGPNSDSDRS